MRTPEGSLGGGPDYSRTHFDSVFGRGGDYSGKAGGVPRPKVAESMFGDLLGDGLGFTFSKDRDTGPKTVNAMRKAEMAKDMDPDKMKVRGFFFSLSHPLDGRTETLQWTSN